MWVNNREKMKLYKVSLGLVISHPVNMKLAFTAFPSVCQKYGVFWHIQQKDLFAGRGVL